MSTERTMLPTPRLRERARREGRFPRSAELTAAGVLFGVLAALLVRLDFWLQALGSILRGRLTVRPWLQIPADGFESTAVSLVVEVALVIWPLAAIGFVLALCLQMIQGGLVWNAERASFQPQRANPFLGMMRLFSWERVILAFLSMLTAGAVSGAVVWGLWRRRCEFLRGTSGGLEPSLSVVGTSILTIGLLATTAAGIMAVAALAFRRWRYEMSLRMTPAEWREAMKEEHSAKQIISSHPSVSGDRRPDQRVAACSAE
jgi:flagellar biosynthesis protein FlhB